MLKGGYYFNMDVSNVEGSEWMKSKQYVDIILRENGIDFDPKQNTQKYEEMIRLVGKALYGPYAGYKSNATLDNDILLIAKGIDRKGTGQVKALLNNAYDSTIGAASRSINSARSNYTSRNDAKSKEFFYKEMCEGGLATKIGFQMNLLGSRGTLTPDQALIVQAYSNYFKKMGNCQSTQSEFGGKYTLPSELIKEINAISLANQTSLDDFKGGRIHKKYLTRNSPRVSAMLHKGLTMEGNDGRLYKSVADKNGRYRWTSPKHSPKRRTSKKY